MYLQTIATAYQAQLLATAQLVLPTNCVRIGTSGVPHSMLNYAILMRDLRIACTLGHWHEDNVLEAEWR